MIKGSELSFFKSKQNKIQKIVNNSNVEISIYKTNLESLYSIAEKSATQYSDKTFVLDQEWDISFKEFLALVDKYADYLKVVHSIDEHDRVGMLLLNSLEFCVSLIAINKIGACAVILPTKQKEDMLDVLLQAANADLVLVDNFFSKEHEENIFVKYNYEICDFNNREYYNLISETRTANYPTLKKGNDAVLLFTSGTTGNSKQVALTNFNLVQAILEYSYSLDLSSKDKTIIATPMYYVTGLIGLFGLFLNIGGTIFIHKFFNVVEVLNCIKENGITFMHSSPTVYNLMLSQKEQYKELNSIRILLSGSSAMPIEKIMEMNEWLPNVDLRTVYGLTETSSPLTLMPFSNVDSEHIASVGIPFTTAQIRITNDKGYDIGFGEIGEIEARGATIIEQYKIPQPDLFREGSWLRTGDVGYISEDNFLYIVDRKKDIINSGGEKVSSVHIENLLYKFKDIAEVAVVEIKDPLYGEKVAAMVVLKPNKRLTEEEIVKEMKKGS